MALTGAQVNKLKSAHQRMACRFVSFPVYNVESIGSFTPDSSYTFFDMVNVFPRHSWIDNSASIVLYGDASIQRGGAAATGHTWTLSGSGSITPNGNQCTYTAPASGSGTATINLTTSGSAATNYAYVVYGASEVNVGQVTGFHADVGAGGWEMTIRAYGDCTGLERQKGIVLKIDMYWNGSEDTFGGYRWSNGVFYGYVDRLRRVHEDSGQTYLEITLISPEKMLGYGQVCDLYFSKSDTGEEIVISDFKVMDAVWYILTGCKFNHRHNVHFFNDDNSPANLKISPGPIWDVCADVAQRTFCNIYCSRQGDFYLIQDPDVRGGTVSSQFTITTSLFDSIAVVHQTYGDPQGDPPNPPDFTVGQVVFTALNSDLEEIWARWPSDVNRLDGRIEEVSGLICDSPSTLKTWAGRYWYKLQPTAECDFRVFAMPVLDLYNWIAVTFTPDSNRVTNTGIALSVEDTYITAMDYEIDPGMGTWRGSFHTITRANQNPPDLGENSS